MKCLNKSKSREKRNEHGKSGMRLPRQHGAGSSNVKKPITKQQPAACRPELRQWPVRLPPGAPHRTVFPERGYPGGRRLAWPSPWGGASTGTCLEGEGRRHRLPQAGRYRQLRGETGGHLPGGRGEERDRCHHGSSPAAAGWT